MYAVALATAFQVKVGVAGVRLPEGATMVAAGGGGVPGTVKLSPLLQGPLPAAFEVTTHHWPAPGFSVMPGGERARAGAARATRLRRGVGRPAASARAIVDPEQVL